MNPFREGDDREWLMVKPPGKQEHTSLILIFDYVDYVKL